MSVGSIGPGTWRAEWSPHAPLAPSWTRGREAIRRIFILDSNGTLGSYRTASGPSGSDAWRERLIPLEKVIQRQNRSLNESPNMRAHQSARSFPGSMPIQVLCRLVTHEDGAFVSTQLKTGCLGLPRKPSAGRRVVIAYSQEQTRRRGHLLAERSLVWSQGFEGAKGEQAHLSLSFPQLLFHEDVRLSLTRSV